MDNTTFFSLLIGALLPMVIEFAKRRKIPTSLIFFVIAVVASLGYNVFSAFVPENVKASIFSFTSQIIATSVILYEVLLKGIFGQMTAQGVTSTSSEIPADLVAFWNAYTQNTLVVNGTPSLPAEQIPVATPSTPGEFYIPPLS